MQQLKLIVVGPSGAGKTTISNFLADATDIPFEHRPTQGVRILEFETQNINVKNRHIKAEIEMWDSSGDHKYKSCWPALRKNVDGVIFVYNEQSQDCVRELEQFYDYFVDQTKLGPKNCVVFHFDPDRKASEISKVPSSTFTRISQVNCDVEEGGNKLKTDFQAFLGTLISNMQENNDQEESNLMRDNILFSK